MSITNILEANQLFHEAEDLVSWFRAIDTKWEYISLRNF